MRFRTVQKIPKFIVLGLIRFYRFCLSPLKPACCRFSPTCSAYAYEAIQRFGLLRGGWLAFCRILKCHPFYRGPQIDPVPKLPPTQDPK